MATFACLAGRTRIVVLRASFFFLQARLKELKGQKLQQDLLLPTFLNAST
jgi:hypothetical protein